MKLVLSDGSSFTGLRTGAGRQAVGEIVFNTSMVGYQEVISDPSYLGQIVVMTYPLMGQYGIIDEDFESSSEGLAALVVGECCESPSNFRSTRTLGKYLEEKGVPCIGDLDTRMLTRRIRNNKGVMIAAVVEEGVSDSEAMELIRNYRYPEDGFSRSSCTKRWFSRTPNHLYDVVVVDFGVKHSLISELNARSCNVTVVPFNTSLEEILSFDPDGVLLSNGPGDPSQLGYMLDEINGMKGKFPLWGIGLGHQLCALTYGASLVDLGCGHHGGRSVRETSSNRIFTAEHNNRFVVKPDAFSGKSEIAVTHTDILDGCIEGFECAGDKLFTCQFYPEGGPGPQESGLFEKFIKMMEENRNA